MTLCKPEAICFNAMYCVARLSWRRRVSIEIARGAPSSRLLPISLLVRIISCHVTIVTESRDVPVVVQLVQSRTDRRDEGFPVRCDVVKVSEGSARSRVGRSLPTPA